MNLEPLVDPFDDVLSRVELAFGDFLFEFVDLAVVESGDAALIMQLT
jgi:hypothetical protein